MIANYIEHTILKPEATIFDIERIVKEANENNFLGVCINPKFVKFARPLTDKKIVTVVNFPLASNGLPTIIFQAQQAILNGADEIDTVINLGALKEKNYSVVKSDISETKKACGDKILKVILETDLLSTSEIETACEIAADAGANFVKTSTGFVKNSVGATVENIKIMKKFPLPVKASGGIKTFAQASALVEAGAQRLGTSSGVDIVKG